jgi:subtilase family serine protease
VPLASAGGLSIDISETTVNQGTGPSGASTTSFYLSRDVLLDASDQLVGSRNVPALLPGANSAAVTTVVLPNPLDPGSYALFAKADGPGSIVETNEFNNTRLAIIQIGPDLTMGALTAPASAGAGTSIMVTDTTTNSGRGPAAASTTRFYLSADFTLDAGDVTLQDRAVPALAGLASSSASTFLTIPASTGDGSYYLIAKADGPNSVAESSETNNTRSVVLRVGPDLVVSSLTVPARAAGGSTISLTETTQNAGTGTAAPSVTAFYLSANILLDASDNRIAQRSVDALAAGASSVRTTTFTVPDVAPGTWYVIAAADDAKTVTETNESNNTRSASILIGPDLTVSSVSMPFTVAAGASITLTDIVRNAGAADAGPSVIRFYLSSNTQLDAGDQVLGERQVPLVAAGLTNTGTTPVTFPSGISGTYYVIAVADATGAVAEATETNNSFLRIVQITP